MKCVKRAGQLVAAAAAIMAASCTAGAPSAATPSARPSAASSPARLAVPASCPVTRPVPHASAPAGVTGMVLPVPFGWYGNGALWVAVPTRGILPAGRPYGTPWAASQWGTKFPWWRVIPGKLTITGHRMGGPVAGFHTVVADVHGYGKTGFTPSALYWPKLGCWQVTGTVAGRSLAIVVWVKAVQF